MILNRQLARTLRSLQRPKFSYVSQKKLDECLKDVDDSTKFGKVKWLMYYIRCIMKEGLKECKEDLKWLAQNGTKRDF